MMDQVWPEFSKSNTVLFNYYTFPNPLSDQTPHLTFKSILTDLELQVKDMMSNRELSASVSESATSIASDLDFCKVLAGFILRIYESRRRAYLFYLHVTPTRIRTR